MKKKLGKFSGLIFSDAWDKAAVIAVDEKTDVSFEFNGKKFTINLPEARKRIPQLLENCQNTIIAHRAKMNEAIAKKIILEKIYRNRIH